MAQRLVRAKQKIRDAGLRFEEPGPDEWPERLQAVLEAVYAAYGLGWQAWQTWEADAAVRAMQQAIGLTSDPAVRLHLQQQGRRWAADAAGETRG